MKHDLFVSLKELLMATSTAHSNLHHAAGWANCLCPLADELRKAEKALFRENRRRKRAQKKAA